jgi:hypothetical protein
MTKHLSFWKFRIKSYSYVSNVTYIIKFSKHFAKTQHGKLDGYLADIKIFYT